MCNPTIEQMRKARGSIQAISLPAATPVRLVGPSSIRFSLTFFGASQAYILGTTEAVKNGVGVTVPQNSATPVLFKLLDHGDLVQQDIYAFASVPTTIAFIETILLGD